MAGRWLCREGRQGLWSLETQAANLKSSPLAGAALICKEPWAERQSGKVFWPFYQYSDTKDLPLSLNWSRTNQFQIVTAAQTQMWVRLGLFYAGITIILPIVNDDFNSVLRFDCGAGVREGQVRGENIQSWLHCYTTLNLNIESQCWMSGPWMDVELIVKERLKKINNTIEPC